MPLISVVMPSYNHERFISEAIRSVLHQSLEDFELIILDDSSRDGSGQIIQDFEAKDARIRSVFHDKNEGIAQTLNEGIERAKGRFVAFLASDDIWVEDKLDRQVKVLQGDEDLIVWSEGEIIDAVGNRTGELFTRKHGAANRKKSGDIFAELLKRNFIFGSSFIARKQTIGDSRFNRQLRYLNDWEFYVDLARQHSYYYISEPLAKYRIHGDSTNLDREGYYQDRVKVRQSILQKYGDVMTNKAKSSIQLSMALALLSLGDQMKAREYLWQGITLNPFARGNLTCLVLCLTREDSFLRRSLRPAYRLYKGMQKRLGKWNRRKMSFY